MVGFKSIPRLIVSNDALELTPSGEVLKARIEGEELHHLINVLRKRIGDELELVERDSGNRYIARLSELDPSFAITDIVKLIPKSQMPRVTFACGYPKPAVADSITEKLVELGAAEIIFFKAEHSQKHHSKNRIERLERVALAALKQSGAPLIPEVRSYDSLQEVLEAVSLKETALKVVLTSPIEHLTESPKSLLVIAQAHIQTIVNTRETEASSETLEQLQLDSEFADCFIVVGPEGALSETEILACVNWGCKAASLGEKTLRCETAVIVACGIILQVFSA